MQLVHFEQSPPRSWDQFEELCADVFQEEWRDTGLVRHGRAGQSQDGVDIVGRDGAFWPVGIQCKKKSAWPVKKLTRAELDSEVGKAKKFRPALKAFYLVSTAPDDEKVQARAREITRQHKATGLFTVNVIGWGDLVRRAARHPLIAAKHFGTYSEGPPTPLLASWRASAAKLLMDDAELAVAIKELIYDFHEFPAGRVAFRKQESDDLQLKVRSLQGTAAPSLQRRRKVLKYRAALHSHTYDEQSVVMGLKLLLSHPNLREYVRAVWEEEAPLLIRSFVEQQIDPHMSDAMGKEKIRLFPPKALPEPAGNDISVLMPMADHSQALKHSWALKRDNSRIDVEDASELFAPVRFGYALPSIIRRTVHGMRNGVPLQAFEEARWFDLHSWKVSF